MVLQITPQANPAGQLLLLDEPMNSLDVAQQSALDKILSALCQQGLAMCDEQITISTIHCVMRIGHGC
ncbi:hypothetical protein OIU92_03235 [Escherichia coli]|nr:hypothetical protein [Escherichia coli]